jgi:type IV pilus assembly protein PilC
MKFRYSARTQAGELQVGFVDAVTKDAALNSLHGHDLYVLSIEDADRQSFFSSIVGFFNRVKRADVMVFTRQFAAMLEAAIPLGDTFKALYRQTRNPVLRDAAFEISGDIDSGLALSQALARHPGIFSEFYINLIQSAEVTGRVQESVAFLADYLEKENTLMGKIKNAMIYPIFVIGLFVLVAAVLMGVVFPQIEPIFADANVTLPFITRAFLAGGHFVASWWLALIVIAGAGIAFLYEYARSEEGGVVFDELFLSVPVLGKLLRQAYVARFGEAMSVLIKGGIPIAQAIETSGHTVGSLLYRDSLHGVAEKIRGGELLSRALEAEERYFPPLVSQMVAVGESTGRLDEMLSRVAQFYTREVDGMVGNLVELIQPALMVVIGVGVGLLFASILLPIYNLVQVF